MAMSRSDQPKKPDNTTIQVKKSTADRLFRLKSRCHSYDSVLMMLLDYWEENHKAVNPDGQKE